MRRIFAVLATVVVLGLSAVGCSQYNDERGKGDAPVENRRGDDAPAVVVNFPDGFANIAFKCLNGNGLYVTTRDAPPVIVKDDPNCDGSTVREFQEN